MRFRAAHKTATFLLAADAVFTLASANALSPLALALVVLGMGLAWHSDPGSRLGAWVDRATPVLNAVILIFLATAVFQVGRSFPEIDLLPFLGFVLFLLVVKLSQRRSNRDYQQVFVISFLVMLAAAWMATSVVFVVGFGLYVVLTTWTLILFHLRREIEDNYILRHADESHAEQVTATRVLNSRRVVGVPFFATTGTVALAVLVGASLVFAMVPRVGLGFILGGVRRQVGIAGFTDEVKLGMHGLISTDNQTVVLRAQIPALSALSDDDARELAISRLYWRGTVYDVYEGGQWLRSRDERTRTQLLVTPLGENSRSYQVANPQAPAPLARRALLEGSLEQTVEIVALTHPVAFALDRPVLFEAPPVPTGSFTATDFEPRWSDEVSLRMFRINPANPYDRRQPLTDFLGARYRVYSREARRPGADLHREALAPSALDSYLRVPSSLTPRVSALAGQIMAGLALPAAKTQAVVDWLKRTHAYTTDLKRDERVPDPLEDFLFVEKAGHCEYFASAAAILLRLGGVPTRYVNGFLGGEWNGLRGTVTVRENRAHSWVEAYLGREGWVRVDATPAQLRPSHMGTVRQLLDSAELFWGRWVIEYSASQQFLLAQRLGQRLGLRSHGYVARRPIKPLDRRQAFAIALGVVLVAVVVSQRRRLTSWRRQRQAPQASPAERAVVRIYQGLLKRLASAGAPRLASETPHEYLARLRGSGIEGAAALGRLTDAYASVRYGDVELGPDIVAELRREASQVRVAG